MQNLSRSVQGCATTPETRLTTAGLREYSSWALALWYQAGTLKERNPDLTRDFAIMGLGLLGESSEVLGALEDCARARGPSTELHKELGDVAYHIGVLALLCDIPLIADSLPSSTSWNTLAGKSRESQAYRLMKPAGAVADILKKFLRDADLPQNAMPVAKITASLQTVLVEWSVLCCQCGIAPYDALALNQVKLNSRHARGTLSGSGDGR